MTKKDFSTRRDLFRKGQIERFKDYKKFERKFVSKRRNDRHRAAIVVAAILMVLLMIIFNSFKKQSESFLVHPESEITVVNASKSL